MPRRTPDCSRFWPAPVKVGEEQPSYDKQYIRNYLIANGLKGKPNVSWDKFKYCPINAVYGVNVNYRLNSPKRSSRRRQTSTEKSLKSKRVILLS